MILVAYIGYVAWLLLGAITSGVEDDNTIRIRTARGDRRLLDHAELWKWRGVYVLMGIGITALFSLSRGQLGVVMSGLALVGYGLFASAHRVALNRSRGHSPWYINSGNYYDEMFMALFGPSAFAQYLVEGAAMLTGAVLLSHTI